MKRVEVEIDGTTYPSYAEAARAYGLSVTSFKYRLKAGVDMNAPPGSLRRRTSKDPSMPTSKLDWQMAHVHRAEENGEAYREMEYEYGDCTDYVK